MQSYFIGIREFKLRVQTSNGKRQGKKKITLQSNKCQNGESTYIINYILRLLCMMILLRLRTRRWSEEVSAKISSGNNIGLWLCRLPFPQTSSINSLIIHQQNRKPLRFQHTLLYFIHSAAIIECIEPLHATSSSRATNAFYLVEELRKQIVFKGFTSIWIL
jgi:hypothetical protein